MTPEQCRIVPWTNIDGDNNLRINYDLSSRSVVYDVGGYMGDWAADIYEKYKCNIEVFEPVEEFAHKIKLRFADDPKIKINVAGLSDKTRKVHITLDGASSSTNKKSKNKEQIQLIDATEFIRGRHEKIDLMKINIEGDEYPLLDNLIASGVIKNIRNLQVQFHIFVPDAAKMRTQLHEKLSRTHELTYNYPWIWENWRRKK
jgi:FkbM family methyltransferase